MSFQLAADSVQVLSGAFFNSIGGHNDGAPEAELAGACPIINGLTLWYFGNNNNNNNSDDDPCAGLDWYILGYLTVVVHVISWGIRWTVWEPAARATARATGHPTYDRDTERKISTYLTECLFFVLSGFFAFRLFVGEAWLYEPGTWLHGRDQFHVDAAVKFYYLLYAARFVSDFISLFFEVGRDATTLAISCIHHAVTLGLIAIAVWGNYMRGAAVIMFFFDWADPPLLLAKCCKYMSSKPTDWFQFVANRLFEVFAVTFFLSRNVIYNFVTYTFFVTLPKDAIYERIFLVLLVLLQTYWFALIVNAVVRRAENDGNVEDVRENGKKNQ
eukprot:scaffold34685_cov183-Amphora_coffeaeformis.AAC.5